MLILLLVGLKALSVSVVSGIMCFVGVIIAFPIFFIFRGLPASKLYVWRLIRLAVAAIFVMITTILFR
jgi:hypothetical protein